MKRRDLLRFLLVGAIGAVGLGVAKLFAMLRGASALDTEGPAAAAQQLGSESIDPKNRRSPISHIRAKFDYLQIDDSVIEAFVRDRERAVGGRPWVLSTEYPRFLLSTDFFQNGADESRPLRYVSFYDPYATPCYQPLVRHADT